MEARRRPVALITGASSGIGLELAKVLAENEHDVALVARSGGTLSKLAEALRDRHSIDASVFAIDLARPGAANELASELADAGLAIDVLVNNAGFATFGPLVEIETDVTVNMVELNVSTLTHLTRLLLPAMIERRHGYVLNVASTAAFAPGPLMAVYYASKAYVLSFSEALAEEVRGLGVVVTALCPGPTRTEFQNRAGIGESKLVSGLMMDARTVALAGYSGLMRGDAVVLPGFMNRVVPVAVRLLPRRLLAKMVHAAQVRRAGVDQR